MKTALSTLNIFEDIRSEFSDLFSSESILRVIDGLEFTFFIDKRIKDDFSEYLDDYLHENSKPQLPEKIFFYILSNAQIFNRISQQLNSHSGVLQEVFKDLFFLRFEMIDCTLFTSLDLDKKIIIIKKGIEFFFIGVDTSYSVLRYPLRVIREIMIRKNENSGSILFHASAVEIEGKGILIPGHKGAGKSSFMSYLLCKQETLFLNNDRVFLSLQDQLSYLPLPIRFSIETLTTLSKLNHFKNLNNKFMKDYQSFTPPLKIQFTPNEFCKYFSTKTISETSLRYIVFPTFNKSNSDCIVDVFNANEAQEMLISTCCTPKDDNWTKPWIVERNQTMEELELHSRKRIAQILTKIPVYRVIFGPLTDPRIVLSNFMNKCFA